MQNDVFIQIYCTGSCGQTPVFLSVQIWLCKMFEVFFSSSELIFQWRRSRSSHTQRVLFTLWPWRAQTEKHRLRAADTTIRSCLKWVCPAWFTLYDSVLVRGEVWTLRVAGAVILWRSSSYSKTTFLTEDTVWDWKLDPSSQPKCVLLSKMFFPFPFTKNNFTINTCNNTLTLHT